MTKQTYSHVKKHVEQFINDKEAWKQDHDQAMYASTLDLYFQLSQAVFSTLVKLDEGLADEERLSFPERETALNRAVEFFAMLKAGCEKVSIQDYGYSACPKKLGHMIGVIKAMQTGVVVSKPDDMKLALKDLEEGETVGIDELRESLQARDSLAG